VTSAARSATVPPSFVSAPHPIADLLRAGLAAIASLPPVRRRPTTAATALALSLTGALAIAAGCGGGDSETTQSTAEAPDAAAFPSPGSGTLDDVAAEGTPTQDLVVAPAGQVFTEGNNRFGFGVFTVDGEQLTDAEIAIYAAPGPNGEVRGPFPARVDSLVTEAAFMAENTAADPQAAKAVYVSDLSLDQQGEWRLIALIKRDGELLSARVPSIVVGDGGPIPDRGDPAPSVHTPTADEVANIQEIDTRVPPDTMHDQDLADVLGEKPVVLLFATPALCQSRVCGPVVDIAEQVKRDRGDDAAFIHMEIYEDNKPPRLRPQVEAYGLPTEPWLFVIDCDGKVDTRIEGAFSAPELEAAIDRVDESC